jgi:hypothetical protein
MSSKQVLSILRGGLQLGVGYVVGHGYLDASNAALLSSIVVSLVAFGWGVVSHTDIDPNAA